MAAKTVIEVNNVSKDFILPQDRNRTMKSAFTNIFRRRKVKTTQKALRDISFEVKEGEFFGIVGRNGSGKSTLLKILANIYQPTKGSVVTRGKLVPFIELGVGFNPELTGRENVYLNGAMLGFSRNEVSQMYEDIVAFAELEDFMDQKLKNYSSGMQVRLAFSMATRSEADILLIDEVLAVGDADFQRKCFSYFKKLKRTGKTVVFVSHDMSAVREYCDRAIMIENSRVIDQGTADKIATRYTRMFIEQAQQKDTQEVKGNRWGRGDLLYSKPVVKVTEKEIAIEATVIAKKPVENINLGFSVADASGQKLFGIDSKTKKKKISGLTAGQSIKAVWTFDNILRDGEYFVELAAVDVGGNVWDWWEEAATFSAFKDERTPYPVHPAIDLRVEGFSK